MQIPDILTETAQNFIDFLKSKKLVAVVTFILIILTISAVIVLSVYSCTNKKPSSITSEGLSAQPFEPDQTVLLPQGPEIPDGYALSRTPHSDWTEKDAEQWFTKPDAGNIEDLRKANDNMISDVIGAAP